MSEKADESGLIQQLKAGKGFLSWKNARDLVLFALILIVAWKLLDADIRIDFGEFKFTDLLALLLALFSVWLSVLFYFKADEASGRFYDNSYKFTKDMSEILGRIEAGFGERLRHLDEGYSGIRDAVGKAMEAHSRVEQSESEVNTVTAEVTKAVTELADKAQLDEPEKERMLSELQAKVEEMRVAMGNLERDRQLEQRVESVELSSIAFTAVRAVVDYGIRTHGPAFNEMGVSEIRQLAARQFSQMPASTVAALHAAGYVEGSSLLLTPRGINVIKALRRDAFRRESLR